MKKIRRILALTGVILLIVMYASTVFCALTDQSGSMAWFKASLLTTFLIPVLLWTYTFVYHMVRGNRENDFFPEDENDTSDSSGIPAPDSDSSKASGRKQE